MVMFAIYVIIPIFQSMWISFYDWDGLGEKVWIGTANYVELIDDDAFYTSLKNNVSGWCCTCWRCRPGCSSRSS